MIAAMTWNPAYGAWTLGLIVTITTALLDVDGFWDPLVAPLDRMAGAGLLKPASRALIRRTRSAEEALAVLAAAEPAHPEKRITAAER